MYDATKQKDLYPKSQNALTEQWNEKAYER